MENNKNKKGFTIIELLIVICIIGILASIIFVSLSGAKTKAQDNAAFSSIKSAAAPAFACLDSRFKLSATDNRNSICWDGISNIAGFTGWPDFSKYGWDTNAMYCPTSTVLGAIAPTPCTPYSDTCGGNSSGQFCFMIQNDLNSPSKWIWCTIEGCKKKES